MAGYNTYLLDKDGKPIFGESIGDMREGDLYVSVSNILSVENPGDFLSYWLLKTFGGQEDPIGAHKAYMNHVSGLGTRIHEFVEKDLLNEELPTVTEDMMPAIEGFYEFKKHNTIEVLDVERIVYSPKYRFAGTLDLRAKINGVPYLLDLKTGTVADKAFVQLAAYHAMCSELDILDEPHDVAVIGGADSKNKIADGGKWLLHTRESFFKGRVSQQDLFTHLLCLRQIWFFKNLKSRKFNAVIKHMEKAVEPLVRDFAAQFAVIENQSKQKTKKKKEKK